MWKLGAVAVVAMSCGCSSTTNVTNVYVGNDASSEAGDASSEAADAVADAADGADAAADTAADTAEAAVDTRPPPFECLRTMECDKGTCCVHTSGGFVDGSTCVAGVATCEHLFTDGAGAIGCTTASDCPSTVPLCCGGHTRGWCASTC
jgi:hypothetical protein